MLYSQYPAAFAFLVRAYGLFSHSADRGQAALLRHRGRCPLVLLVGGCLIGAAASLQLQYGSHIRATRAHNTRGRAGVLAAAPCIGDSLGHGSAKKLGKCSLGGGCRVLCPHDMPGRAV